MKKLLFSLSVILLPFLASAQLMDTNVVFLENFDVLPVASMTSSTLFSETNWRADQTLFVSAPNSYHVPSYASQGNVFLAFATGLEMNRTKPYVYLKFDHICKMFNNDRSQITYCTSTGTQVQYGVVTVTYTNWKFMSFSQTSPNYHGGASTITDGNFSQNCYTDWVPSSNPAVPQNTWWKTELIDITEYVDADTNDYFKLRFYTNHTSGSGSGSEVCAGWYLDNVQVIYSNVELVPPTITLQPTIYQGNVNNNTGPFTVKAKLMDNDTINMNSIVFWYHTSNGDVDTLPINVTSNTFTGGNHVVMAEWTIPQQCYGTTVDYHISLKDVHGSENKLDKNFFLNTTVSYQVNDAKMESFNDLPLYPEMMTTGQSYPIKVTFRNKGKTTETEPNHMTSAVFGWSVNGVQKPDKTWTGDLCLDYTDTIVVGSHVALADSNYIKVWIKSRNGVSPLVNFTDDTIYYDGYGCSSALSGTYTLGGPNADFPTVRYMKERFYRCGFDGPVTININPGTYTGFNFDYIYTGLSSTNTITFQAAPGVDRSAVILVNNGTTAPLSFTEMGYVTVRNVTIRNTTANRCVDFTGHYSQNITIDNCLIQGTNSSTTPYTNSVGIGRTTAPQPFTGGSGDKNLTFTNNTITNVNYGISFIGGSNAAYKEENFVVTGNDITTTVGGISASQAKAWTIDGNDIKQAATASDLNFVGINVQNAADFASISGNSIRMNERGGTGLSTSTYANSTGVTTIVKVANNEIINKVTTTGRYNIQLQNTKQMNLYHNSSYMYSLTNVTQSAPLYITGSSTATNTLNVFNNIFYNASTSAENKNYAIYLNYTSLTALAPTIKLNNNEYYTVGSSLGWFMAPRNTFAEWQSALASRGEDTTSVNIPLDFVSATDSLVPINYEGLECLPVSGITTDIRGTARYNTITFMGCYTRSIPATDLAITELTSPVLGNECPAVNYPIKIRIKNTGSAVINFASKPATIAYTVGTTSGTATVSTGSIAPLQTKEVTVVANFPVTTNTVYNYVFNITINGDANHLNDTLTGSFEIQAAFPYFEESFSSVDLYPAWQFEQISTTGAGNWTVETGAGVNPAIAPNFGLGRLFFNSKNFVSGTESRAIMPVTILQGATTPILEYWFAHDNTGSSTTEGITVKVSVDGGLTYTAVNSVNSAGASSTFVKRYNNAYTTPAWEKYMVDLDPYSNQSCIYIAFDAKSNAKNNINIDRVVIRNFYHNDLAVNDIWALGQNPVQHEISPVIMANITNEGRDAKTNFKMMLEITGANTYRDTITVPSLASRSSMVVTFPGAHLYNSGDNDVRVYCEDDMNNDNNESHWFMTTSPNVVAYAVDSLQGQQHVTYSSIAIGGTDDISYTARYQVAETLVVRKVMAYITNTANNSNIGRHFQFFVADANGNVIERSEEMTVTAAMENTWVSADIHNLALTSTSTDFYAGIEMLDGGTYLGVQEEAPLRTGTFYTLNNGTYTPATNGRLMIGAEVDAYMPSELAILTLDNPNTNCDLGHEHISVTITNNGTTAIPAGTPIHYTVNNGTVVNETITQAIESHETITFAFNTVYDFTNNAVNEDHNYNVKVWVDSVATDRLRFNDTLSQLVISYGKAPMPTAASPVHAQYRTPATLTATDVSGVTSTAQFWYTNAGYETWELQYVGNPFITPDVYFDTTYYVTSAPATFYERTVGTLTPSTTANNITQPFVYTAGYSRGKLLYKEDELNGAVGQLTQIGLYVTDEATGEDGIPMRLYVMPTDLTTLTASSVTTWDDEIAQATLIYDGNYFFGTTGWHYFNLPTPLQYEGGNLLILTETYCGGSSCAEASGSSTYPKFNSTSVSGGCLYKSVNTNPNFTGNYSTNARRLNMKFQFVDADCQSEKVPVQVIVDGVPTYDVEPVELVSPITNSCTLLDENIVVSVRNLINNTIPAGTVEVKAKFNNQTVSQIVNEPFAPNEVKNVTFTQTVNLSAPTADVTYNYTIVTDLIGTPAYRGNDTITGSLVSWKTASVPDDIEVTGEYLHTYTIQRQNTTLTKWMYEDAATGTVTTVQTNPYSYTTPILYDTAVYYVYGITTGHNCETRHLRYQIDIAKPLHDLATNALVEPLSFQCGVSDAHLKVNVSNTWPTADTIPANTFKLKADFTGAGSQSVQHTIAQPIYSSADQDITFTNTVTLGSATQNKIYNYTIYSNPVNSSMYVYRNNDTISGTLHVPATPAAPANITVTAPYGQTTTITPTSTILNQFYFYEQQTGGSAIAQGTSFTTPPIMANPTHYYYSGRILDPNFAGDVTVGAGTTAQALPFNFTKEHSQGIIMYTKDDLGFSEGVIDTIKIYVQAASSGEVPMKLYLKNDNALVVSGYPNLTPALVTSTYNNNWTNITNGAQVIVEGPFDFSQAGWYTFVIPGGFHYDGNSLLLITEHDGSATSFGYSAPTFRSTTVPSVPNATYNKRVVHRSGDAALSGSFTQATVRLNTKFSISYACESADRGVITINTTVPPCDLEVAEITNPITPDPAYTNNETVTIKLKNHGSQAATNYTLAYQLADNTPVTVTNPISVPAGGNAVNYSFTQHVDLSNVYFPTEFKVFVTASQDNNHSNDTLRIMLRKEICESGSTTAVSPSIANIKVAGIDNEPLPADWTPFGTSEDVTYTNYANTVAPGVFVKGQSYEMSITNAFPGTSGTKVYKYVFIDYNRNGQWEVTGANAERVLAITNANAFDAQHPEKATSFGTFTVPATATEGLTLMRVIGAGTNPAAVTSGCGYYPQGETEDYAVIIRGAFDNDLAITGYMQPIGSVCRDSRANIKVYVKNTGVNAQTLSETNALTLTATVTGAVDGTYTESFMFGTIAPGETKTFTIPNVNLSASGSYHITTALAYTPDEYAVNNSWSTDCSVANSVTVDTVSHLETFDETIVDPESPFTSFWTPNPTTGTYLWDIHMGASANNPTAGPAGDHTTTNNMDQYAIVAGISNQTSLTKTASLTTNCIDLHYRNGYPIQMEYFEHIMGAANATASLVVEVSTGNNFVTVDSVAGPTQNAPTDQWKQRVVMFTDNDEVAKVRFRTIRHTRLMDIAVDDVYFTNGTPDIGVADIIYPTNFQDPEGECLVFGDTIHPIVAIENAGRAPVSSFEITARLKVGNEICEHTETWNAEVIGGVPQYFMPGDTMEYTFENGFGVFQSASFMDFEVLVHLEYDCNPYNDHYTIHPCGGVGIEDYVKEGGLVLQQNVPNPADEKTRITFVAPKSGNAVIEIFNVAGQRVYSEAIHAAYGENYLDINTSSFSAGTYVYTLQFEDAVLSRKMIIQK
ncbi:MAG: GEVED domain-containing protein [Bacteroidales bacterium]|nr:GEVED domain-containing protein [Bacteroidales bacterium]